MGVRVPRPLPPSVSSRRPGQRRRTRAIQQRDRKSTRLNSSHDQISYAVFCLKKKNIANYGAIPLVATSDATSLTLMRADSFGAKEAMKEIGSQLAIITRRRPISTTQTSTPL